MTHRNRRTARLLALAISVAAVALGATPPATSTTPTPLARAVAAEVWQQAQPAHDENPTNPLAGRLWGVYAGPQDQVTGPYQRARGERKRLIGKIALRPRAKWYGAFVPDASIRDQVTKYVAASQGGDPEKLVQLAVFRMKPWAGEACVRPSTAAEKRSYKKWMRELAAGIGSTPMAVVMQPDLPFLWCAPDRSAKARLLTWATQLLSALPRTSVYLDAGAADWCQNGRGADPETCAQALKLTGVRYARGFALDSTHYNGPAENVRHGVAIVDILRRDGYGTKHFVVDTAKSGRPMTWPEVVPASGKDLKDNARVCTRPTMRRCVTLGIPPTARPGSTDLGLPEDVRRAAATYVDGFLWFGRPWLFNQADPFVRSRAIAMARTTPWPGPA
ncbi:glycoside hydrolase family 6 protein [Nocardioides sp. W7]|uniref:glycoside hydrolase family 6 protein n=1 Tax=Nocardioides sp. W7 TaxID=2931390 RepID=UPI001FD1AE64|nr:glycoside hydrolase family 6 protein [Nocardioides sp. W7]